MAVIMDHWEDLGDGRARVFARTPLGEWASVVIGRDLLGTATMYAVLDAAARSVDKLAAGIKARAGRIDWED